MKHSRPFLPFAFLAALFLAGCAAAPTATVAPPTQPPPSPPPTATVPPPTATAQPFTLASSAFAAHTSIPPKYACHAENVSPPLAWSGAPSGTKSFTLIFDDPDAASVVGYIWDHWILFDIPATTQSLDENIPAKPQLPDGSRHGLNSFGHPFYGGPCPPSTHNYRFTLYALDTTLGLNAGAGKGDIQQAMHNHILAQTELIAPFP